MALFCGLRIGEVLGLKWRYVDLDKREPHVRYQVQRMRDGSGLVEAQPKQNEQRTAPFGERVAAALKAHRLRQNEERLARGAPYGDRDLVFATGRGTMISAVPSALSSLKSSRMPSPDLVSRFPVGSSASTTAGLFTRALAIAARCFCPSESSGGLWVARLESPTLSRSSVARRLRSAPCTPG